MAMLDGLIDAVADRGAVHRGARGKGLERPSLNRLFPVFGREGRDDRPPRRCRKRRQPPPDHRRREVGPLAGQAANVDDMVLGKLGQIYRLTDLLAEVDQLGNRLPDQLI